MEEEFKKDEGFWDDKSSKTPMLIVVALLLAIGVGVFIFLTKDQTKKPTPNDTLNNINTPSDEATKSDDIANTNGKKIYIYAKGFADNGPIAFTYDCISEYCNIITTEKGIILYDEDKVQYRILSKYEQEQIFNSDSPAGGPLDKEGFKEIVPTRIFELEEYDESDENKEMHNLYKIEKENYFLVNNQEDKSVYNFKDYCEYYKDMCIFDKGLIAYYDQIYNLDTDTFIYELEDEQLIEKIEYKQSFIIVKFISDSNYFYLVMNEKNKNVLNTYVTGKNSYYLKNEQLYYIKDNKVLIENSKGDKTEYDNTNITPVYITGSMLLYLDNDNQINLRDLNTNKDTYNSEIITQPDLIELFYKTEDDKFELIYNDYNVLKTDEWFNSFNQEEIDDGFDINTYKNCTNENYKENISCRDYIIGYKVIFDKEGKYISKENFLGMGAI